MYRGKNVAVVVPAYNEQARIAHVVRTVPDWVDFVIVVDDASRDETALRARAEDRAGLVVLRHHRNRGVGRAIFTGYEQAHRMGADLAVVMAGDGQMDPADLPGLIETLLDGADYVKGNRFADPSVWRVMPRERILGNLVLSLVTKVTSGYRDSFDSQCGYTAIALPLLDRLDTSRIYGGYSYCNDLLCHLHRVGARVRDVRVRPIYDGAESGIRFRTLLHPIAGVLLTGLVGRVFEERGGRLGALLADTVVENWKRDRGTGVSVMEGPMVEAPAEAPEAREAFETESAEAPLPPSLGLPPLSVDSSDVHEGTDSLPAWG